ERLGDELEGVGDGLGVLALLVGDGQADGVLAGRLLGAGGDVEVAGDAVAAELQDEVHGGVLLEEGLAHGVEELEGGEVTDLAGLGIDAEALDVVAEEDEVAG